MWAIWNPNTDKYKMAGGSHTVIAVYTNKGIAKSVLAQHTGMVRMGYRVVEVQLTHMETNV